MIQNDDMPFSESIQNLSYPQTIVIRVTMPGAISTQWVFEYIEILASYIKTVLAPNMGF